MSLNQANNYLAVNLHRLLSQEKKNVFFSPFSISVAMGMLLCGAKGKTASELRTALGHEHAGVEKEDVAPGFEQQMSLLLQHHDSYTLSFANSMLFQKGFNVKDEYKQIVCNFFKSLILEVDFERDTQKVLEQINEWAKEKTNGMIPKFIEELDSSTVVVLLNAVYFKGTWMNPFNKKKTKSQKFYNNGRSNAAIKVEMMHMKGYFYFYEGDTFQALKLPYVGDDVAMMILLPHEKNGLESLEAALSLSLLKDITNELEGIKVNVAIPRFRLEYDKSLIRAFKELGVQCAFNSSADFSQLSGGIFVSEIFHKAVLDVNEEGSEAAAVTMISMDRSSPRATPEFVADHPFMLMIYNTKTDLILFMGRVNELKE